MPALDNLPLFGNRLIFLLHIGILVMFQCPGWWVLGFGPFWHPVVRDPLGLCWVQTLKDLAVVIRFLDLRGVHWKSVWWVFHHSIGYLDWGKIWSCTLESICNITSMWYFKMLYYHFINNNFMVHHRVRYMMCCITNFNPLTLSFLYIWLAKYMMSDDYLGNQWKEL